MELVGGRISHGASRAVGSVDDAIRCARSPRAGSRYEQGIAPRPEAANVMVRPDGMVKIRTSASPRWSRRGRPRCNRDDRSNRPLARDDADQDHSWHDCLHGARQGRGKAIDRRVDVGLWLHRLRDAVGTRPFDGETVTDVLSAIVSRIGLDGAARADLLDSETPAPMSGKDPRQRLRDIGEPG
jgi:hypothetical protein